MAIALLVPDPDANEPVVGPDAAERLAGLGVTRISLLQDPSGVAVVLEGWAFDPSRIDEAVRAVFPDGGPRVRILHEIAQVAVSVASGERRRA